MKKLAVASLTLSLVTLFAVPSEAAKLRPGYYAHSLLVFGNGSRSYETGCLRWHWQNMSWYDHCVVAQQRTISVRY